MRRPLALLAVAGLLGAACSTGGDASTPTSAATPATTTEAIESPSTTTTASPPRATTAPASEAPPTMLTDGTTVTDETIYVGILADLSGPFSGNVIDLVDSQLAFWADLNARGGIAGRRVEVLVADTGYDPAVHQLLYADMVDQVVMFTHSTGSPHTAAIADDLVRDERLAIPVGWYSGWSDPVLGANLLEIGSNYCVESANAVSYLAAAHQEQFGEPATFAIATDAGDYGQDSAAGAKLAAEALDIEVVYDGEATLAFGAEPTQVAVEIALSGADYTWVATDPATAAELVAQSLSAGYRGSWSGATPAFSPRLLDTALGDYLASAWLVSVFFAPVGADVDGMDPVYDVLVAAFPDRYPSDGLVRGYLDFALAAQVLEAAAAQGDLTPAGVVAASRQVRVDFGGISPANTYGEGMDVAVARTTGLYRADKESFDAQGGLDAVLGDRAVSPFSPVAVAYESTIVADLDFTEPCWEFGDS